MEILLQLKEDTDLPKEHHSIASSSSSAVSKPSPPPEYEHMIQKLEGEVRQHIRVSATLSSDLCVRWNNR